MTTMTDPIGRLYHVCTTHLLLLSMLKTAKKQNAVTPNAHCFKMSLAQVIARPFCKGTIGHVMTTERKG